MSASLDNTDNNQQPSTKRMRLNEKEEGNDAGTPAPTHSSSGGRPFNILKAKDLCVKNVFCSEVKSFKIGSYSANILYSYPNGMVSSLSVQTPKDMQVPFGISLNPISKEKAYSLQLSLPVGSPFYQVLTDLDKKIQADVESGKIALFESTEGEKLSKSDYHPIVRLPKRGKEQYDPAIRLKIPFLVNEDRVDEDKFEIYDDETKQKLNMSEGFESLVPRRSSVTAIFGISRVWRTDKNYGVILTAKQIRVRPPPATKLSGYAFDDEDDEPAETTGTNVYNSQIPSFPEEEEYEQFDDE